MNESVLPHELPQALNAAPATMRVLSLDCFDTLLWRDCFAPSDVFAALDGVNTGQRMVAETRARKAEATMRERSEVTLAQIYNHALPNGAPNVSDAQREAASERELAMEARTCFAFEPTVELMRASKARGHAVIITSDTYLSAEQLEQLIRQSAGDEVADLIDRVFTSSDAGISKSQGLLAKVMKAMKYQPHEMLHIGDNRAADFDGARALGIPALHLEQFGEAARKRMKFERSCQQLVGDADKGVRGLMPQRAVLARDEPQAGDPASALGLSVLGPVFHAFDKWLRDEAEALAAKHGGRVHWLFMLRDGHLPHIVHEEGGAAQSTARVEISRFAAIAASLTTREAYREHFALEFGLNPETLARQMLLDEAEIARIIGPAKTDEQRVEASLRLRDELRTGQREKVIRRRARARAERLVEHVRAALDPQPGDTLMLVDLGYNGSAQDRIDGLLAEALNVHVAGRYLLLREMAATGLDKKGLLDQRHCDPELLEAMCGNVAVIEQLATCELGSVVDYSDAGEPIRKQSSVKGAQSEVRDRVQAGVVAYAKAANAPPIIRREDTHAERGLREGALGTLMRFMFLPLPGELEVLKQFEHDVNLGSERMVPLFDEAEAREGMRRRGLFYMNGSSRMFLPAELAGEDMSTRLSLLVQKRFGLGLSYTDSAGQNIEIPVFYLRAGESTQASLPAVPTHDGFYSLRLPIVTGARGIAVQMGAVFEWFELARICSGPVSALAPEGGSGAVVRDAIAQFDAMTEHTGGLYECSDPAAFVLVNPPALAEEDEAQMLELVFRPIRKRMQPLAPASASESATPGPAQIKDAAA